MGKKTIYISTVTFVLFLFLVFSNHLLSEDRVAVKKGSKVVNNFYLMIAKEHYDLQEYDQAMEAAELAILLEPENKEAQSLRDDIQRILGGGKQAPKSPKKTLSKKETAPAGAAEEEPVTVQKELTPTQKAFIAFKEKRYNDVAEIVNTLLEEDPTNKEALYLMEVLNDEEYKLVTNQLKTVHKIEKSRAKENLREAAIPYQDILRYPTKENWEDVLERELPYTKMVIEDKKSITNKLSVNPDPVDNQINKKISDALNTVITFEFIDTALKDVIAFMREKTKVNIIIDSDAGDVPVTLKLNEVTVDTALDYALPRGYEYVVEGNIIHIYRHKMELRVYDVRDILINIGDHEPYTFDINAAASASMAVSGGELREVKDATGRMQDLILLISSTIEPGSWATEGSAEGGVIRARQGQPGDLVVLHTRHVHEKIGYLLASLRTAQNIQVSIEARFITVSDDFMEEFGNNLTSFFTDDITVDTGAADIAGDIAEGITLDYAVMGIHKLEGFLKAVQESNDSEILTSPRITLSNTQRGNIAVIRTENYVRETSVEDGIVTPEIGSIPQGTTFDVRPIVTEDRKYVYLEVTPSVFEIEEIESFNFSGLSEDVTVGGGDGTTYIPPEQIIQLPKINVSQVSVTVCVPDKGTLMIGGLGSFSRTNAESGFPILSKIPILKRLFSSYKKTNNKQNLIILLKPTIILMDERERNYNQSLKDTQAAHLPFQKPIGKLAQNKGGL